MTEAGLGLEELALVDEVCSDAMAETVESRAGDTGGAAQATELVSQGIRAQVGLPGRRRRKQPLADRVASEVLQVEMWELTNAAVVAPRVRRRDRADLVEPSTPWDRPRSMVSTRPSRSE